jgi:DNA (cytosine-5)-methyltransferase 1
MARFRILDLFCCAGGSAMGLHQAGLEIVGVDIKPQPHYPFEFIQADAIEVMWYLTERRWYSFNHANLDAKNIDAYWASPPCQAYMDTRKNGAKPSKHPRLIEPTRSLLERTGKPYIIENVHKAPIRPDLMLCGTMFGLRVIRHRYFEMSFPAPPSPSSCNHWSTVASGDFIGVYAFGGKGHRHGRGVRDASPMPPKVTAAEAMGIDWMTGSELTQAIPPAYSRLIGEHLVAVLEGRVCQ